MPAENNFRPILYVFAISHFCEKARFVLDHLGIDTTLKHLPPGAHAAIAKGLGAPGSSLPILVAAGEVVQGSAEIMDWAEAAAPGSATLTPSHARQECVDIEKRLDDVAGIHVRRAFYSEALGEHPETILPIFVRDLTPTERTMITDAWPGITKMMIELMNLGPDQEKESVGIVDAELRWLDELLSDGRSFLAGDVFSRADIAAASLLAPLVRPGEHPNAEAIQIPPRMAEIIAGWQDRPSLLWIREIYRQYR